jgi:alanine dehydrogenase
MKHSTPQMQFLNADTIRSLIDVPALVGCLEEAFRATFVVPERQVVKIPGGSGERIFASMPAFDLAGRGAVKLVTLFPDNRSNGLPTHQALIVVFSEAGTPRAILDGTMVTHLRTGAASALASKYLSRPDSAHLVIIGTGALAPYMALAHCAVRPISRISVWGRESGRAAETTARIRTLSAQSHLATRQLKVSVANALDEAVSSADIITCATRSATPVLQGKWLQPGSFVDLVGSFSPNTREADDDVVLRSRIFVDTHAGAFAEAGDILNPLARRVIERDRIEGELSDLVCGRVEGRVLKDEITLFKSVGTAIEDIAAAQLIVDAAAGGR